MLHPSPFFVTDRGVSEFDKVDKVLTPRSKVQDGISIQLSNLKDRGMRVVKSRTMRQPVDSFELAMKPPLSQNSASREASR